jgi:hypothetical protein
MSNKVGIRKLRQQASAVLRSVTGGEGIEVTSHAHPFTSSVLEQLLLEGRAVEPTHDLIELIESLGVPIAPNPLGQKATAALEELRSDER